MSNISNKMAAIHMGPTNTNCVVNINGSSQDNSSMISFNNRYGNEIFRVNGNGSIVWAADYNMDEAAEALSKLIPVSIEYAAGVTNTVKNNMRDSIFQEIIEHANTTGSVSTEELTFLWQAVKIVDKLKGST